VIKLWALFRIIRGNIDYYMAFFISYPLPARGHDISARADRLQGMIYELGLIKGMIWNDMLWYLYYILQQRK